MDKIQIILRRIYMWKPNPYCAIRFKVVKFNKTRGEILGRCLESNHLYKFAPDDLTTKNTKEITAHE